MSTPGPIRLWAVRVVLVLTLAVLIYLPNRITATWFSQPIDDYVQYWASGRLNATGGNPYSPQELLALEKAIGLAEAVQEAAGLRADEPIMMWNPPWTLSVTMPFALLDFPASRTLWFVAEFLIIVTCADWLWCIYEGPRRLRWLAWLLAITFYPTLVVILQGQISPFVLLGMVGFLYFQQQAMALAAGALAALGGVKPHLVYLFWVALILTGLDRCGRRRVLGCTTAGLLATALPLACNPAVLQQYWTAIHTLQTPAGAYSPTLGSLLRLSFGENLTWLHVLGPVAGLGWVLWYWIRHRKAWAWDEQLPLLLIVSLLTSYYGGWTVDRVVLLIPVIHAAVLTVRSGKLVPAVIALSCFIAVTAPAPILLSMRRNSFAFGDLPQAKLELLFAWMTPVLLVSYLLVRQLTRSTSGLAKAGDPETAR
jgi:hypothetical protein